MLARDVVWEPGMTLLEERMHDLASELREGLGEIPRLTGPGASTDQIADAVWAWMGTRTPSQTWGWEIADPADLRRAESILLRDHVHWVHYDAGYGSPMVATMLVLFAREIGPLPEDAQYEASPATDPDGWNWPTPIMSSARRVYRWRVRVSWKGDRPYVKLEKLMQLQKLVREEWKIYNKGGQNQLYALQPNSGSWWSGADVGDWLETHALEIADVVQGVAWAMISVVTLGAGGGAAAGVTTVRIAADILKSLAVAAQTGKQVDVGQLFAQLGAAGAALIQVPGVSDLVREIGAWAEKAGQTILSALPANGVFTSLISSGGGFVQNLASEGSAIYSQAKGWYDQGSEIVQAASRLGDAHAQAGALLAQTGNSEIDQAFGALFAQLKGELGPGKAFEQAKLEIFQTARDVLDQRLTDLRAEVEEARVLLPAHLQPWFDRGRLGKTTPEDAPFYAQPAVGWGRGASQLEHAVTNDILRAKRASEANLAFHDMIGRYGLLERYRLFSLLEGLSVRYKTELAEERRAQVAREASPERQQLKALWEEQRQRGFW